MMELNGTQISIDDLETSELVPDIDVPLKEAGETHTAPSPYVTIKAVVVNGHMYVNGSPCQRVEKKSNMWRYIDPVDEYVYLIWLHENTEEITEDEISVFTGEFGDRTEYAVNVDIPRVSL